MQLTVSAPARRARAPSRRQIPAPAAESRRQRLARAGVLCVGIAVEDFIFRVDRFPTPGTKTVVEEFVVTGGGCAANAAITIARLGGAARFAGPLGDDPMSDRILAGMAGEGVDVGHIERVAGGVASFSGIFIDPAGERLLATRRSRGLRTARAADPDALLEGITVCLADNHFPRFALPICRAARRRGLPVVLDIDRAVKPDDPLLALATHPIFSAEALRGTSGMEKLEPALARVAGVCASAFVAVTDGANGAFWRAGAAAGHVPAFAIDAIDTLAAGDVFHGGFALALAEGSDTRTALRFGAATAGLKCTRFGGIAGAPRRAAVEALIRDGQPRRKMRKA
jgi:sulfofructose kinase